MRQAKTRKSAGTSIGRYRQSLLKSKLNSAIKGAALSRDMSHLMFWMTLLVLAVSNLIMVTVTVPLLLFLGQFKIIGFVVLGLFNGYLFYILISKISSLERRHHLAAAIIIPGLSIIDLFIIMNGLGRLSHAFGIISNESPIIISIIYIVSFLAPYFVANMAGVRGASAYP